MLGTWVFSLWIKPLNPNRPRFYQLHALGRYEFFRLALSCEPVPTEVVSHKSSIWSLELNPVWIHLKFFFCSAEKCHIATCISFTFCQFYNIICVVPVSSSCDKVSQYFFTKSTGNYLVPKKKKHRSLSKEEENTQNGSAGCMQGQQSSLVSAVAGGSTAVPASHPVCLPPELLSQRLKFNSLFTSAP